MSSVMDSLTSRLTATTISSASKTKSRSTKAQEDFNSNSSIVNKKSSRLIPANCGFKFGSLRSRIGMGTVPKMIAAEKINHETDEGRKEFYYQVCYLMQKKLNVSV
ncbi:unnamed protein product [Auanema sp. JU1783]|nr:unnamed protein product [Auanema sp. JU1783]